MKRGDLPWLLLRWALALVFIYAGLVKLVDPAPLAANIVRFQLVPLFLVHPMALTLPPLEVLCGVALLVGPWKRQAAFGITVLCAAFLVALLSAAVRGLEVDCTCFGSGGAQPMWWLIVRDLALLGSAAAIYLHQAQSGTAAAGDLNAAVDCRQSSHAMKSAQLS